MIDESVMHLCYYFKLSSDMGFVVQLYCQDYLDQILLHSQYDGWELILDTLQNITFS